MRYNDPAPKALRAFFERNRGSGKNKQWLAHQCRVSRPAVHYWAEGVNRPESDQLRQLIEALTGVRADLWLTKEERSLVNERAAKIASLRDGGRPSKTGTEG